MNIVAMPRLMIKTNSQSNSTLKSFFDKFSGSRENESEDDGFSTLNIPAHEMTPAVRLAIDSLSEKLSDTKDELEKSYTKLEEMESLVDVDCLTPLPNRRAFMRRLNWAMSMNERYDHDCTLVFFDLNEFKSVNDSYGHAIGDAVIQYAAEMFDSMTRSSDFLARLGGDEFAIIMYHANFEGAKNRAKFIAKRLADNPFFYKGNNISVSTAFGVHQVEKDETFEVALHRADMAMFENKKQQKALDA